MMTEEASKWRCEPLQATKYGDCLTGGMQWLRMLLIWLDNLLDSLHDWEAGRLALKEADWVGMIGRL